MLELLATSEEWFMDGTFSACPSQFYQLYTIHSLKGGFNFPCVFALLQNKTQETYERLFQGLLSKNPNLQPRTCMMDFEKAVSGAVSNVFPQATIAHCFFHLCQAVYRKVIEVGLKVRYGTDPDFALLARQLPALAFVPDGDIEEVFQTLEDDNHFPDELEEVISYFEATYIGKPFGRAGRRKVPLFPTETWNQYQRTLDGLSRTNNAVEGWHRAFLSQVVTHHPSIWKFIDCLRKEAALSRLDRETEIRGGKAPRKNPKYQRIAAAVLTKVQAYPTTDIKDYLKAIAYNYYF
ncbi:MAG: transposase [Gammaproteobacteria bacterium]|nr:transposase [Gammaproteobacteria bacterium]